MSSECLKQLNLDVFEAHLISLGFTFTLVQDEKSVVDSNQPKSDSQGGEVEKASSTELAAELIGTTEEEVTANSSLSVEEVQEKNKKDEHNEKNIVDATGSNDQNQKKSESQESASIPDIISKPSALPAEAVQGEASKSEHLFLLQFVC